MKAAVGAASRQDREFLPSLALIRAVAALMVVYDHLVGMWLTSNRVNWQPAVMLDRWVFDPLHLMMHGGGLAVAMFFLVSGFVIFFVGYRETHRQFAVRRALRIFPPLWVSIILLLVVYGVMMAVGSNMGEGKQVESILRSDNPWPRIAAAMTLTNYLLATPAINGVAWTLIIEVLFYIAVALLLPLLRKNPRLAMVIAFMALAALQILARVHWTVFLLAVNGVYVTFLFLGSLIYLLWAKRIGMRFFVIGTIAFWGLFMHGIAKIVAQPPFDVTDYGVSYAFAWLAFVVLLLLNDRIRLGRVTMFFSRISYSLYLNHGGIGLLLLSLLYPVTGYPLALVIAFGIVVGISAASYRWVEAPSQRLARTWTTRAPTQPLPVHEAPRQHVGIS
jgi:peptidoglycan/LPS O-acetylase OafA/YrhL